MILQGVFWADLHEHASAEYYTLLSYSTLEGKFTPALSDTPGRIRFGLSRPTGYSRCLSGIGESSGIAAPALATAVGIAAASLGLWLTGLRQRARVVIPFSAGVLIGVALFGLLPELASEIGWPISVALFGVALSVVLARRDEPG